MRAFVRVLLLLAGAADLAACTVDGVVGTNPGGARYAAVTRAPQPLARTSPAARPEAALLARRPPPQCERAKPPEGIPPDQARAATLDYAQQCYRQLAELAHARLNALQDAAAKTPSFASAHPALLERQPPPHCDPAKPPADLGAAEAREARLDAELQCYKALEASNRQRLDALQDAFRTSAAPARSRRSGVNRAQRARYVTY